MRRTAEITRCIRLVVGIVVRVEGPSKLLRGVTHAVSSIRASSSVVLDASACLRIFAADVAEELLVAGFGCA